MSPATRPHPLRAEQGEIDPSVVVTRVPRREAQDGHRLPLADAPRAYRMFNNKEDDCIKVVLQP
jgi:threonine dehydrogenase-like Zn-dependent dehydrogenase